MSNQQSAKQEIDKASLSVGLVSFTALVVGCSLVYAPAGLIVGGLLGLASVILPKILVSRRPRE